MHATVNKMCTTANIRASFFDAAMAAGAGGVCIRDASLSSSTLLNTFPSAQGFLHRLNGFFSSGFFLWVGLRWYHHHHQPFDLLHSETSAPKQARQGVAVHAKMRCNVRQHTPQQRQLAAAGKGSDLLNQLRLFSCRALAAAGLRHHFAWV